ncbi:hypothetical protein AXX17_AT5G37360 [Arabidopsis thaliana]|uniref:B3 domain-containing protein n=1 Tax=Arabidopsis thaliana TaxID=3702 RepID=A0A178UTJ4_ARATH|nr:hypothetical protein AXX17_AT5G37360 [Arabidopsis thaliana]
MIHNATNVLLTASNEFNTSEHVAFPNYQSSSPSSCLTENTNPKRRAVEQRKSKGGFKTAKVVLFPLTERETPEWVFQKLIRNDFLTPAECRAIEKDEDNEDEENIGVGTILVNQRSKMWGLRFKIWAMEKDSGHGTLNYTLNWGWNDVVKGAVESSALLLRHGSSLICFISLLRSHLSNFR